MNLNQINTHIEATLRKYGIATSEGSENNLERTETLFLHLKSLLDESNDPKKSEELNGLLRSISLTIESNPAYQDIFTKTFHPSEVEGNVSRKKARTAKPLELYTFSDEEISSLLGLDSWETSGNKDIAKERIIDCYRHNKSSLDLSCLDLSSLPEDLFRYLPKLEKLDLNTNQISEFTLDRSTKNLKELDLSRNNLSSFTVPFCMTHLESLNVSSNQLTSLKLPKSLTNLRILCLKNNNLSSLTLPTVMKNLQELDLCKNKLTSLPNLSNCSSSLERLDLSLNQLSKLTFSFPMNNLKKLEISHNNLATLTLPISADNLESVDASDNLLSQVTFQEALPNLKKLDIHKNQIENLPLLNSLPSLQTLDLSSNKLIRFELPLSTESLKDLNLSNNALSSLTLSSECPKLETLHLNDNKLVSLTLSDSMQSLKTLYANKNGLSSLTLPLSLVHLKVLDLSDNRLPSFDLPDTIKNLTHLYLKNNKLTSLTLPASLTQLNSLLVSYNLLSSLTLLGPLENLRHLTLFCNLLPSIDFLHLTPNLETLDVSYNQLKQEPKNPKIQIEATENPFSSPVDEPAFLSTLHTFKTSMPLGEITEIDLQKNPSFFAIAGSWLQKLRVSAGFHATSNINKKAFSEKVRVIFQKASKNPALQNFLMKRLDPSSAIYLTPHVFYINHLFHQIRLIEELLQHPLPEAIDPFRFLFMLNEIQRTSHKFVLQHQSEQIDSHVYFLRIKFVNLMEGVDLLNCFQETPESKQAKENLIENLKDPHYFAQSLMNDPIWIEKVKIAFPGALETLEASFMRQKTKKMEEQAYQAASIEEKEALLQPIQSQKEKAIQNFFINRILNPHLKKKTKTHF